MASKKGWNPYLAGILTGLVIVGSAVVSTQLLGKSQCPDASGAFVWIAALLERLTAPEHAARLEYCWHLLWRVAGRVSGRWHQTGKCAAHVERTFR